MKWIFPLICLSGFLSVLLGAAGDHLLQSQLSGDISERWDVALRYHQLYSVVLLCLCLYGHAVNQLSRFYTACVMLFLSGLLLFCGSLYLSIFMQMDALTRLTPVGGILLMAGWLLLAFSLYPRRNASNVPRC